MRALAPINRQGSLVAVCRRSPTHHYVAHRRRYDCGTHRLSRGRLKRPHYAFCPSVGLSVSLSLRPNSKRKCI